MSVSLYVYLRYTNMAAPNSRKTGQKTLKIRCTRCETEKSESSFYFSKGKFSSRCKSCSYEQYRKTYTPAITAGRFTDLNNAGLRNIVVKNAKVMLGMRTQKPRGFDRNRTPCVCVLCAKCRFLLLPVPIRNTVQRNAQKMFEGKSITHPADYAQSPLMYEFPDSRFIVATIGCANSAINQ